MEEDGGRKGPSKRLQNAKDKVEEEEKKQTENEKGLTWREDGKIFSDQLALGIKHNINIL